jgi:hypothetical protein
MKDEFFNLKHRSIMSKLLKINFLSSFFMVSLCLLVFACKKETNVLTEGRYIGIWTFKSVVTKDAVITASSGNPTYTINCPIGDLVSYSTRYDTDKSIANIDAINGYTNVSGTMTVAASGSCTISGSASGYGFSFTGTKK